MKNDITYEYRVFTNRLIDVESMEVGKCTSKVIKELKQKDKVDGRFFHTSDTDEWYFCWNGKLQKLNLKGNSDVNDALDKVEKLIAKANETSNKAEAAATVANSAANEAKEAVKSIENKADKSDVEAVEKEVELKADKSVVDELSAKVDAIKFPSLEGYATEAFVDDKIAEIKIPTKVSELENDKNYLTDHQDISGKQDVIGDLEEIRSNAELAKTALQESDLNGYATEKYVDDKIKQIEIPEGVDLTELEAKIAEKQDKISDLETIRSGAAAGATALQSDALNGYATEEYVSVEISKIQNSSYDDTEIRNELDKKANQSELFSKSYNDLTDKPELFSGSYNDLTNTPDLFSGSYNDLTDKPTIPSIEGLATESYADSLVKDSEGKSLFDAAGAAETAAAAAETAAKTYTDSKLASIEEELERITNKILGV